MIFLSIPGKTLLFLGRLLGCLLYIVYQLEKGIWVSLDKRLYKKYKIYSNIEKVQVIHVFVKNADISKKLQRLCNFTLDFLKLHKLRSTCSKFQVFGLLEDY